VNFDGGNGTGTVATATLNTIGSGGNPGEYGRIDLAWGGQFSSGVVAYFSTGQSYTPATADEIISITYNEDQKYFSGTSGGQAWWLMVKQGDQTKLVFGGTTGNSTSWVTKTLNTSLSSIELTPTPGVPIYFGFVRSNQNGNDSNGIFSTSIGIDNWTVTVNVSCP
jgi:hypothetical protein